MPTLNNVLSSIPGYGAYTARREQNEQAGMDDLRKASALQQLYAGIQQQDAQRQQAAQGLEDRARNERVRAAIAALPPDQRTRENVLPILLEHTSNPKDIAGMLPESKKKTFHPVGAGGLYDETSGTVIPPTERPVKEPAGPEIVQLQRFIETLPAGSPARASIEARIKHLTERQAPVQVNMPASSDTMVGEDGKHYKVRIGKDGKVETIPLVTPTGATLAPTAGKPKEEGMTPENAGKVAMSQQAVEGIGTVRGIVFDKDGKLNRGLVGAMNLPIVAGLPGNSQARIARTAIRNAVEAKLRIETGAAATESEVERTLARFLPTVADTDESAKFKLNELEKFFKSSLSLTKGVKPPTADAKNDPLGIR